MCLLCLLCRYQELLGALRNPAAAAALRARYPLQASPAAACAEPLFVAIRWHELFAHTLWVSVALQAAMCSPAAAMQMHHAFPVAPAPQAIAVQLADFVHTASSALPCLLLVRRGWLPLLLCLACCCASVYHV